jgi:hypothetical protein
MILQWLKGGKKREHDSAALPDRPAQCSGRCLIITNTQTAINSVDSLMLARPHSAAQGSPTPFYSLAVSPRASCFCAR